MGLRQPPAKPGPQGLLPFDFDESDDSDEVTGRAGLPLLLETMMALQVGQAVKQHIKLRKTPFEDARPKRLRFAVFNLPARLVSHARRLCARVARSLLERADLLLGRSRLRTAWAA